MAETAPYRPNGLPMDEALDRGLAWLFTTDHPEGSMVFHLGDTLRVMHNRILGFMPSTHGKDGTPVVTLDVQTTQPRGRSSTVPHTPLAPDELHRLAGMLADRGHEVVSQWNGFPHTTGSLALATPLHPSMRAALDRYRAGCPAHDGTVFCSCPLWREGYKRLVPLRSSREVLSV